MKQFIKLKARIMRNFFNQVFVDQVMQKVNTIRPYLFARKIQAGIILFVSSMLILLLILFANHASQHQDDQADVLVSPQLGVVQEQLKTVIQLISGNQAKIDQLKEDNSVLPGFSRDLHAMQEQLGNVVKNTKETQKTFQRVGEQQRVSNTQLNAHIEHLTKVVIPESFLSASTLPFTVSALDFWNSKPMLTIVHKSVDGQLQYRLMAQSMTVEGWTLQTLNVEKREAIFVNTDAQKVKVSL